MARVLAVLVWATVLIGSRVNAQDLIAQATRTMERADVKRAFDYVDAHKDQILGEWIGLTEINAPSGKERDRATAVKRILETCKLDSISYDSKGNLIAVR